MFHAMVRFTLILLFVVLDACKRVRESWTKGSSGVRPVILWAGLMGCEDTKAEDCTVSGLDSTWCGRQAWRPKIPFYVTDSM